MRISSRIKDDWRCVERVLRDIQTDLNALTILVNELRLDHATNRLLQVDLKAQGNAQDNAMQDDGLVSAVVLSIGTGDDKKIKNTEIKYRINGVAYVKAITETVFQAGNDVTADKFGTYLLSIQTDGTLTLTQGTVMNGADEDAAIVGIADTPAGECRVGYITMTTANGAAFDAGTDSPEGGVSGAPSLGTNYYPDAVFTGFADVATSPADSLAAGAVTLKTSQG